MTIPQITHLHKQSFTSAQVEFIWLFQEPKGIKQFVFGVKEDKTCYIEVGPVDAIGNYIEDPFFVPVIHINHLVNKGVMAWGEGRDYPPLYNNFSNGQDLIYLAQASLDEYLRFT